MSALSWTVRMKTVIYENERKEHNQIKLSEKKTFIASPE